MGTQVESDDGWTLRRSTNADVARLMPWFADKSDVEIWGGPTFRYPFTRKTFYEDIYWGRMDSFSLYDSGGNFTAFGQLYDRDERAHLARLIVSPDRRRQGIGKRLIRMLMGVARSLYARDEYSLFVFRDNVPAFECYKSLGFTVGDYPADMPHADVCYFLTRAVEPPPEEREDDDT